MNKGPNTAHCAGQMAAGTGYPVAMTHFCDAMLQIELYRYLDITDDDITM